MKCIGTQELVLYLNRQIDAHHSQQIANHLRDCPSCETKRTHLEELGAFLAEDEGEFNDPTLSNKVLQRIHTEAEEKTSPLKKWYSKWYPFTFVQWAAISAALVVVISLWFLRPVYQESLLKRDSPPHFQVRGDSGSSLDRWVSLKVFKKTDKAHIPAANQIR